MAVFEEILRIALETSGEAGAKKLSKALDELGVELKDAGPEAQVLLGELRKLSQLSAQVNGVTKLKGEIYDTGNALALAKIRTRELEAEFANTLEPSKRLTRELDRARKAVTDLTAQENRQNAELQRTQNAMRAAGLSTDKLGQAQQQVRQKIQETTNGLRQYAASAATADKASDKIGGTFTRLRGVLAGLGIVVSLRSAFEGVKNLLGLGDAAEKARIQLTALYGSQRQGREAFEGLRSLARQNGLEFDAVREAAVRLKALGLEPLDGTLQALIDQNAKLGGSQETLTGIGLAVGQMWTKQRIQTEELLQLTERGVPVFDLLAKVTGKQGQELQKLIESGKLGRVTIKALIDEIGRSTSGAAAKNLNTLSGLVGQLASRVREFFEDVSNRGPLQFFKDQLRGLIDTIDSMARTDQLANWAQSVGQGIVQVATALRDGVLFLRDYSGAILQLVRAFALFKIADTVATWAANTKALEAMKKAAEAPIGTFGRLRAAIAAIPKRVVFTLATVGVDWTLNQIYRLVEVTKEYIETRGLLKSTEQDLQRVQTEALAKARSLIDIYRDSADAQVASAEELATKSEDQSQAYQRQLENAIRYHTALRIEQRALGDSEGVTKTTERLRQLVEGLQAAQSQTAATVEWVSKLSGQFARKVAADFEVAREAGKTTAEALSGIFDKVDLGTAQGIKDAVETFQVIVPRAQDARKVLETELLPALKKLTGEQLVEFQRQATEAFGAVKGGAEASAAVLRASLQAALDRLKVDAARTGDAFTAAGKDILATFQAVVTNAQASGAQIAEAFRAALGGVKTVEEAEALGEALRAATDKGTLGAQATERAMIQLRARIRELKAETDPLADSFDLLGIKSQRALDAARDAAREAFTAIVDGAREGAAAQGDIVRAFEALAAAERQAVAQGTASEQARVESLLAAKAAALGLSSELERAGVIGKRAGDDTAEAMRGARDAIEDTAAAAGEMAAQQTRVVEQVQATNSQIIIQTQLTDAQRRALLYLGQQWDAGKVSAEDYGRTLEEIMSGGTEAIERQIEAAERARDALRDLTDQLRDEADRAAGNEADIERRRYQEQLDRIKELEEAGGAAARREALEARRLAEEEHRRRLAEIREQARARREADAPAAGGSGSSTGGGGGDSRPAPAPSIPMNFNMRIEGGVFASNKNELARMLDAEFRAMFQRGGFIYNQVRDVVQRTMPGARPRL